MDLLDGIESRVIETDRGTTEVLVRTADDTTTPAERTVVLLHDDGASNVRWQELMQDLPRDLRVVAVDLRGFGVGDQPSTDGASGHGNESDAEGGDVRDVLATLGLDTAHLVGCALGDGVSLPYAIGLDSDPDRPAVFRRALLEAIAYIGHPASPAPPTSAIIISSSD